MMIMAKAMVGIGMEIGGRNGGNRTWYSTADSDLSSSILLGGLIFIVGLIIAGIAAFQKTTTSDKNT